MELFALSKIKDEGGYLRAGYEIMTRRSVVAAYFFSQCDGDSDDEIGNPFEQDCDGGYLGKDTGMLVAADFWFGKNAEIFLRS